MTDQEEASLISRTLRELTWVRIAFGASLVVFLVLAKFGPWQEQGLARLESIFQIVTVVVVIVGYVLRRFLLSEQGIMMRHAQFQGDSETLAKYYKQIMLVTFAVCEAVGLLGMAMVASGSSFKRSIPFFALGLMALVIFRPKRAELENIIRYGKFLAS
ncbi:MAG: hypothetical protein H6510_07265 [Acidobacteria bacterium]|nr:hypothetical protein [Acidobacteriota bacterium]MCB9397595.1 hypothetical protein [Acidobacteriota bacterium]